MVLVEGHPCEGIVEQTMFVASERRERGRQKDRESEKPAEEKRTRSCFDRLTRLCVHYEFIVDNQRPKTEKDDE